MQSPKRDHDTALQDCCQFQGVWPHKKGVCQEILANAAVAELASVPTRGGMQASGLLDETLVVMMGEFGRTPKLVEPNGSVSFFTSAGRDHWMTCFFGMFAGAGVRGGQVIGRSDAIGAFPATRPYRHSDVAATVYTALGIDPALEVRDLRLA
jgi:uncharacterized protein (DUF1501 family)